MGCFPHSLGQEVFREPASGCGGNITAAPPPRKVNQGTPQTVLTSRPNLQSVEGLRGYRKQASGGKRRQARAPRLRAPFPARARDRHRGLCAARAPALRARADPAWVRLGLGRAQTAGGRAGRGRERRGGRLRGRAPQTGVGRRSAPLGLSSAPAPSQPAAPRGPEEAGGAGARGGSGPAGRAGRLAVRGGRRGGAGGAGSLAAASTGRQCRRLREASLGRLRGWGRRGPPARMWVLVSVPRGRFTLGWDAAGWVGWAGLRGGGAGFGPGSAAPALTALRPGTASRGHPCAARCARPWSFSWNGPLQISRVSLCLLNCLRNLLPVGIQS